MLKGMIFGATSLRPMLAGLISVLFGAMAASPGRAQTVITLRMIDGRTGKPIPTNDFIVRINREKTPHNNWVAQNEDGTARVTLPAGAETVSIHATYESTTAAYINCDSDAAQASAAQADHWYSVADIASSGIVARNNCIGKKVPARLQVVANPGQFVFFVRKLSAKEQFEQ